MRVLGKFEIMLFLGEITEEEYLKRKKEYVDYIFELYIKGIIDENLMYEKLNE